MDRLTKQDIEKLRDSKYPWAQLTKMIHGLPSNSDAPDDAIRYLCDLALRSLSQEAVREEVLEEAARLRALINTPEIEDFLQGVRLESAHQVERWGTAHDREKSAENWYWLVGYLGGKALRSAITGDRDKALHHCISSAAALMNWHSAIRLDTSGAGIGKDGDIAPDGSEIKPIEALKREPNAAGEEIGKEPSRASGDMPAPATPDVAEMVRTITEWKGSTLPIGIAREAATLLAKLGQEWIPMDRTAEYQEHHFKVEDVGVAWNGNRVWVCADSGALLRAKVIGEKLFVEFTPPAPGASDE